jgi:hypothetical protein
MKKKLKIHLGKYLKIFLIVHGLIQPTFVYSNAQIVASVANTFTNATLSAIAQQNALNSLGTKIALAPNPADELTGSTLFQGSCQVVRARSAFTENVCKAPSSPQEASAVADTFKFYENLAIRYEEMYENMKSKAKQTPFPSGTQCLKNRLTNLEQQIQLLEDSLRISKTNVENSIKDLIIENEKIKLAMKQDKNLLDGGGDNIDDDSRDLADKIKDPICITLLENSSGNSPGALSDSGLGLNNLRTSIAPMAGAAKRLKSKSDLLTDLQQQAGRIVSQLKSLGSAGFNVDTADVLKTSRSRLESDFSEAIQVAIDNANQNVKLRLNEIKPKLERSGLANNSITSTDSDFLKNIDQEIANFPQAKRIEFENKCIFSPEFGKSKEAYINDLTAELLANRQKQDQKGQNLFKFKDEDIRKHVELVFNQTNITIDTLKQAIAEDSILGGIAITNDKLKVGFVNESIDRIFGQAVDLCKQAFTQDVNITGFRREDSISEAQKVKEGVEALTELKKIEQDFQADLGNSIINEVLSCGAGNALAGPGAAAAVSGAAGASLARASIDPAKCNEQVFETNSAGFCIDLADSCRSDAVRCEQVVKNEIKKVKDKIKANRDLFNNNVKTVIDNQRVQLRNIASSVRAVGENIKRNLGVPIKDVEFKLPEESFSLGLGEPSLNQELGVILEGGGDMEDLREFPKKIELFIQSLNTQKENIASAVQGEIDEVNNNIEIQRQRWVVLKNECRDAFDQSKDLVERANAEGLANQAKEDAKDAEFCSEVKSLVGIESTSKGYCEKVSSLLDSVKESTISQARGSTRTQLISAQIRCDKKEENKEKTSSNAELDQLCAGGSSGDIRNLLAKHISSVFSEVEEDQALSALDGDQDAIDAIKETLEDHPKKILVNSLFEKLKSSGRDFSKIEKQLNETFSYLKGTDNNKLTFGVAKEIVGDALEEAGSPAFASVDNLLSGDSIDKTNFCEQIKAERTFKLLRRCAGRDDDACRETPERIEKAEESIPGKFSSISRIVGEVLELKSNGSTEHGELAITPCAGQAGAGRSVAGALNGLQQGVNNAVNNSGRTFKK